MTNGRFPALEPRATEMIRYLWANVPLLSNNTMRSCTAKIAYEYRRAALHVRTRDRCGRRLVMIPTGTNNVLIGRRVYFFICSLCKNTFLPELPHVRILLALYKYEGVLTPRAESVESWTRPMY